MPHTIVRGTLLQKQKGIYCFPLKGAPTVHALHTKGIHAPTNYHVSSILEKGTTLGYAMATQPQTHHDNYV